MSNIFRKSVIERLSSPEQLDKMIRITGPLTWLFIVACVLVFIPLVFWSIGLLQATSPM